MDPNLFPLKGGNIVLVTSYRLASEKKTKAALQILVYPWLQLVTYLPSMHKHQMGLFAEMPSIKFPLWYLGIREPTDEMLEMLLARNHTLLLDASQKRKFKSYLDTNLIPARFKLNREYYERFECVEAFRGGDETSLDASNILVRDEAFRERVRLLFSDRVSPGLADAEKIGQLPKTYTVVCEWDGIKDEALIFAERMRLAGVDVTLAHYHTCFHAMVHMIDDFEFSNKILEDINDYLKRNLV
jgi:acetyl esterase/lipase